jgi:hypothetical protein
LKFHVEIDKFRIGYLAIFLEILMAQQVYVEIVGRFGEGHFELKIH